MNDEELRSYLRTYFHEGACFTTKTEGEWKVGRVLNINSSRAYVRMPDGTCEAVDLRRLSDQQRFRPLVLLKQTDTYGPNEIVYADLKRSHECHTLIRLQWRTLDSKFYAGHYYGDPTGSRELHLVSSANLVRIPDSEIVFLKGDIVRVVGDSENPNGVQAIEGFIRNSEGIIESRLSELDKIYRIRRLGGETIADAPAGLLELVRRGPGDPWPEPTGPGRPTEDTGPSLRYIATPLRVGDVVDVREMGRGVVVGAGRTRGTFLVELDSEKPYGKPRLYQKLKLTKVQI